MEDTDMTDQSPLEQTDDGPDTTSEELSAPEVPSTDSAAAQEPSAGPSEVIEAVDERGFSYEVLGERAVQVAIPSGDVVMGAMPLLTPATTAVAVLAQGRDGSSAVLMRDGQDVFVVRRDPGAWEHFRSLGGPTAVVGSWQAGQRTRFRQAHGALWQAITPALELAEKLGIAELMPQETPPPPKPVVEKKTATRRASAAKSSSAKTGAAAKAGAKAAADKPIQRGEPLPPICPHCFTQLPSTGKCDCADRR